MYNYELGIFFSFIYSVVFMVSVFQKSKKEMLKVQVIDQIVLGLSNFFLMAYSAVVTNIVNTIRNYLTYKGKLTKTIGVLCIIFYVVFGLMVNVRGFIGFLPIIASSTYVIFCLGSKNVQQQRAGLILNLLIHLVHDIYIKAYPTVITEIIVVILTTYNIYKDRK